MNIIFLDIDGVLNCQIYYQSDAFSKKDEHPYNQICKERVKWLNKLCEDTNSKIVISSTWRMSGIDYCKNVLSKCGATFDIIGATPIDPSRVRGVEIKKWIETEKCNFPIWGVKNYAIIDDDSDMLLEQRHNFFHTDNYSGLTPNTCYKITRFFNGDDLF